MKTLLKSHVRFVGRHPVGALATSLGITLAVMVVVTVHVVGQSIRGLLDAGPGGPFTHSHVLTAPMLTEQDYFELRARWRRGEFPTVLAMTPVIDDFLALDGQPPIRIIGFDPLAGNVPTAAVAAPSTDAATFLTRSTRDAASFLTRDVVMATTKTAEAIRAAAIAVDVVETAGDQPTVGPAIALADLPTAQHLLGREAQLDAVWLHVSSARSRFLNVLDALLPGIAAALPRYADPTVAGFSVAAVRSWNPASRFADALAFTLGALALLSLLMAALISAQASYSNAARRRVENDRLLAIGVSPRLLWTLGIAERCVLGAVGTAVGIALGIFVSEQLLSAAYGGDISADVKAWVIAKAVFCGLAVCTLAPAPSISGNADRQASRFVHILGALGLLAAILGLAYDSLLAAFGALAGVSIVQMTHAVPGAAAIAGRLAGTAKSMATRANLRAANVHAGELRLALGAFSVAVATTIGMGLMVESLREDFNDMLKERLWPGIHVSAEQQISAADAQWVETRPGVRMARRYADVDAKLAEAPARVSLATLDAIETRRYGFTGALVTRAMLNEVGSRQLGLTVGDTVTVTRAGTGFDVEIGHVFRDFGAPSARLILPAAFASQLGPDALRWQRLSVFADEAAVQPLAAALAQRFRHASVRNQSAIRAVAMDVFDRTFLVSRALTGVALAVAVIGLYAALTALQTSREREFKLLNAIGYGRGEIWRLGVAQTTTLGLVAACSAVPLGIAIAWVLCNIVQPLAFGWSIHLRAEPTAIALPVLLGVAGAVAAGAIPAYRSSFGQATGTPSGTAAR